MPIGLLTSRSAYSTTALVRPSQSRRPRVGPSCGVRIRSSRSGKIEVEFACIFRLEAFCFQLDNKVAMQPEMVEKQIDVKGLVADRDWHLAAHKSETPTEFEK